LIFAGHYLDKLFIDQFGIDLKKKLELIIIVIVLITTVPVIIKFLFGKKQDFPNMKIIILMKTKNKKVLLK
jgi:membrane-associated protein